MSSFSTKWLIVCKQNIPSIDTLFQQHDLSLCWSDMWELVIPVRVSLTEGCYGTKGSYWLSWSNHFESLLVGTTTWLTVMEHLYYKLPRICSFVVSTFRFTPHSWLITVSVSREIRWMPIVEQALLTLSEHMISSLVLSGVRVSRYSVYCFGDWCLSFLF